MNNFLIFDSNLDLRLERKALTVTVQADGVFPLAPSDDAANDANMRYAADNSFRSTPILDARTTSRIDC